MRKKSALVFAAVMAFVLLWASLLPMKVQAENIYEVSGDQGFETPEECIQYFVGCLADNDLEGAVKAFAVDNYIDNIDYFAYLDRLKAWSYDYTIPLNPEDDLSRQLDKASLREEITQDIRLFCISLGLDLDLRSTQEITDTEAFLETISMKDLSSLEVERLIYAEPETQDDENYRKGMQKLWDIQHCENMEEDYIFYTLEDERYFGSAQFVKYNGLWYLSDLNSTMAGMSTSVVFKLTDEEYEMFLEELEK